MWVTRLVVIAELYELIKVAMRYDEIIRPILGILLVLEFTVRDGSLIHGSPPSFLWSIITYRYNEG